MAKRDWESAVTSSGEPYGNVVHWESLVDPSEVKSPVAGASFRRAGYRSLGVTTGRSARRPPGHAHGKRVWTDASPKLVLYRGPLAREAKSNPYDPKGMDKRWICSEFPDICENVSRAWVDGGWTYLDTPVGLFEIQSGKKRTHVIVYAYPSPPEEAELDEWLHGTLEEREQVYKGRSWDEAVHAIHEFMQPDMDWRPKESIPEDFYMSNPAKGREWAERVYNERLASGNLPNLGSGYPKEVRAARAVQAIAENKLFAKDRRRVALPLPASSRKFWQDVQAWALEQEAMVSYPKEWAAVVKLVNKLNGWEMDIGTDEIEVMQERVPDIVVTVILSRLVGDGALTLSNGVYRAAGRKPNPVHGPNRELLRRRNPSKDASSLPLVDVKEYGKRFATGVPVEFDFYRRTDPAPNLGSTYQQDIEPSGRYMIHLPMSMQSPDDRSKHESGTIRFRKPLVLALTTDEDRIYGPGSWKALLQKHYGGKKGRVLSKAIAKDGYDGIVTVWTVPKKGGRVPSGTREIVDLTWLHGGKAAPIPDKVGAAAAGSRARWKDVKEDARKSNPTGARRAKNPKARKAKRGKR